MSKPATRDHIVEVADNLFYQRGFDHTSFTDIAKVVNISRGNFYHHFKTKDEILNAVIDTRLDKTQEMINGWEKQEESPEGRIKSYIRILIVNWNKIKHYGCPVGTLCTELAKLNHASHDEANKIFTLFRTWLTEQFIHMGRKKNEADDLAMHVLAWSQGAATLANTFHDKQFAEREVDKMCRWLDSYSQQPTKTRK